MQFHLICSVVLILFSTFVRIYASQVESFGNDCVVENVLRQNGERFEMGCTGMCRCRNGSIACVSMCPPFGMPPECRTLKKTGDCCPQAHCPNDIERGACETEIETAESDYRQLPWLILIDVQSDSYKGRCMGTMIDRNTAFASPDCSTISDSRIIYPPLAEQALLQQIRTSEQGKKFEITKYKIRNQYLDLLNLKFTRKFHEINTPYQKACFRLDCTLFIGAFDPTNNRFRSIRASQTHNPNCEITEAEEMQGIRCLEIRSQDYPDCVNLAGGVVMIKSKDHFFLKGFVARSPFLTPAANSTCDSEKQNVLRYYDFCAELSALVIDRSSV